MSSARLRIALVATLSLTMAALPAVQATDRERGGRGEVKDPPTLASAPGYRQPANAERVFPVARSRWYSVINFADDWHAPRMRLIDGRWKQIGVHEGNDIFGEPGTPVRAVTGGVVERAGWLFYSGWRVGLRSTDGRYWFYAHMASPPSVAEGQSIAPGQVIGELGNTGYGNRPGHKDEFAPHLHVGIQEPWGEWIDPYPLMKRLYRKAVRP